MGSSHTLHGSKDVLTVLIMPLHECEKEIHMGTVLNRGKNAANKHAAQDWHREEIKCAIRLKGYSIAALSRANGLAGGTLANALIRPWPKGEQIIAHAIGIAPEEIWPTRYKLRREKESPKNKPAA